MAIQKKIQLYVSDATGAAKTAKYYRIPLPADTLPVSRTTNLFKDLVRFYAKVSGDKFYIGVVCKGLQDAIVMNDNDNEIAKRCFTLLVPSIPDKLLNDGEATIKIGTLYTKTTGFSMTNLIPTNFDEGSEFHDYSVTAKEKFNIFNEMIISDSEGDLGDYVPSTWQELDSIDTVLADIQTWKNTTPEWRGPLFTDYSFENLINLSEAWHVSVGTPTIDLNTNTVTTNDNPIKDLYMITESPVQGNITITSTEASPTGKVYLMYLSFSAGSYTATEMTEYSFEGNTITVPFDGATNKPNAYLVLAGDAIHGTVTATKA